MKTLGAPKAFYDTTKTISVSSLRKCGFLRPGQWRQGIVGWTRNGNHTGEIGVTTCTFPNRRYLQLYYTYDGVGRNYRVNLVSVPSNLGRGSVWYFLCPMTGKRCRILYFYDGAFVHREAFKSLYYAQSLSHKARWLFTQYKNAEVDNAYDLLHSRYFKRNYAGKPTQRFLRIFKRIHLRRRFTDEFIQALYLGH